MKRVLYLSKLVQGMIQSFRSLLIWGRPMLQNFLDRASAENVVLQDATYGCMLRALSNSGRLQDAIEIHLIISERKMGVNDVCYNAFASGLCTQKPSGKVHELLKDLIAKGFHPDVAELSRYIKVQCENLKWKQAEHSLNYILDKGFVPDYFCCCSLVKYYCSSGQVDLAIKLHNKMKLSQSTLTWRHIIYFSTSSSNKEGSVMLLMCLRTCNNNNNPFFH
ncbi:OLC1v1015936C1 [Oldenlandia corymbosa var. corymbosa]|uniref:OLC1v1015936C1 n=1 Tax=Oldenlandia corymbosa var. corymbosa TaxID=529605 RepID=A0AAV1E6H9_OLDCO|nr:OLC1v1015936C1 [Oldenlandia corymbosa var. corymbosa]